MFKVKRLISHCFRISIIIVKKGLLRLKHFLIFTCCTQDIFIDKLKNTFHKLHNFKWPHDQQITLNENIDCTYFSLYISIRFCYCIFFKKGNDVTEYFMNFCPYSLFPTYVFSPCNLFYFKHVKKMYTTKDKFC